MLDLATLSPTTQRRIATLPSVTALTWEWGKRAAIRETDGGQTKEKAQVGATEEIWKRYPGCFEGIHTFTLVYAFKEAESGRDFLLYSLLFTDLYPPMVARHDLTPTDRRHPGTQTRRLSSVFEPIERWVLALSKNVAGKAASCQNAHKAPQPTIVSGLCNRCRVA